MSFVPRMERVMDGSELRQLIEQHNPGPRLVPASDARREAIQTDTPAPETRDAAESG